MKHPVLSRLHLDRLEDHNRFLTMPSPTRRAFMTSGRASDEALLFFPCDVSKWPLFVSASLQSRFNMPTGAVEEKI